ncbi:MAG: aldehyde ferredoxin oxidoreductase family protein [Thermomicrobiales bacterium]
MANGFMGNILVADLTAGTLRVDHPDAAYYRRFMGGAALAMDYILRLCPAHADPLGPENVLVFAVGPLTGAPISGQSRMSVNAKSPLSGVIGDAQVGGFFPAELKFAGFDAVVVLGKAAAPTYLHIQDGAAELRDAGPYWGMGTGDLQDRVEADLGDGRVQLMAIGVAGENLVKYACILNMASRAAGRTGLGAVMGSKNLKFISCRGTGKVGVADPAGLKALTHWGAKNVRLNLATAGLQKYGTAETVMAQQLVGGLPTRNWESGVFAEAEEISGERMRETIHLKNDTCFGCAVRCKRVVQQENIGVEGRYGGPEYETLATLGAACGIGDLGAIALANQRCNIHGMDPIAVGATIAWAMDAFTTGAINGEDTGGLEIEWGDAEMMLYLTEVIALRQGFGDVLAEGMRGAAERLGKGGDLLTDVKGNALPAHMPQLKRSLALVYAVNPYGADHQAHEHDPAYAPDSDPESLRRLALLGLTDPQDQLNLSDEKVRFALIGQQFYSLLDSVSVCQFVYGPAWQLYGPDHLQRAIAAVTGWDLTVDELVEVGARKLTMQRLFNARDGVGRSEDTLPKKLFKGLKGGPSDGLKVGAEEFAHALDRYYELAGWDVATGMPTPASLARNGLAEYAAG